MNSGNGPSSGHVCVYAFDTNTTKWEQVGQDIEGEDVGDYSVSSVSLSGDGRTVAIGAATNNNNAGTSNDNSFSNLGHVRVYTFNTSTTKWEQAGQDIDGEAADDQSGTSVSLSSDGSIVAIGAPYNDDAGDYAGHVRVYLYNTNTNQWDQIGQDIDGEAGDDSSGSIVSVK